MNTKKISLLGLLIALSLLLGYIEFICLPDMIIPGVKIGLSNLTVVLCLCLFDYKDVYLLAVIKVFLSCFLFSSMACLIYSMTGILFSITIMIFLYRMNLFSIFGISMSGAVFHNIGQLLAAILITGSFRFIYYGPVLIAAGLISGFIIAFFSKIIMPILKNIEKRD